MSYYKCNQCGCNTCQSSGCNQCGCSKVVKVVGSPCLPTKTPCSAPVPIQNCNPPAPCSGVPYYGGIAMAPEDNTQKTIIFKMSQVFKSKYAVAVPACGASINIVFEGLIDVAIGSYLWAYQLGIFEITGFNPETQEVEITNNCQTLCGPQAAPGTPIPSCTLFVVTIPPCPGASQGTPSLFPFLAAGFTAPSNGNCIDITVTNVSGLIVGKNIGINGGTYELSAINSATNITICNNGAGLTPGVVVDYDDDFGNYIVPIILIDVNPCTSTLDTSGAVLTCNSGVTVPITGASVGHVLTLTNTTTGEAEYAAPDTTCCDALDTALDAVIADILSRLPNAVSSYTPVVTINVGTVSNTVVNQAVFSRVGAWLLFKVSVSFDLSSTGGGSTLINITAPTSGVADGTAPAYACHADDNSAEVPAYWRYNTGLSFTVFQAALAPWGDGSARVDIDGKYRAI